MLPWWLVTLWMLNGYSLRVLTASPPPCWEPPVHQGEEVRRGSPTAQEQLEDALLPLLRALEGAATTAERIANLPTAGFRVVAFAALPAVAVALIASVILTFLWSFVTLLGGAAATVFYVVLLAVGTNLLNFHRELVLAWLGARADETDDGLPFHPGSASGSVSFAPPSGRWLNTERRGVATAAVSTCGASFLDGTWRVFVNLFERVPDEPRQVHLAIARSALQVVEAPPK